MVSDRVKVILLAKDIAACPRKIVIIHYSYISHLRYLNPMLNPRCVPPHLFSVLWSNQIDDGPNVCEVPNFQVLSGITATKKVLFGSSVMFGPCCATKSGIFHVPKIPKMMARNSMFIPGNI